MANRGYKKYMNSEKKTIVITGASDGIGFAAAKQLKLLGHNVIIVGRNAKKTKEKAKLINCPYHIADFSNLSQVTALAKELNNYEKIDVLANNAGAIFNKREITIDGFEKTFQTNVLSSFLLTNLLLEKLITCNATIINTTSIASNVFSKNFDVNDLQNERHYTPINAYGESKLCNVLFTRELHNRYYQKGLNVVAFEPGITRSNFGADGNWFLRLAYHSPLKYLFTISTKKSAKRLVRLALGDAGNDFFSGKIYSYKKQYKVKFDNEIIQRQFYEYCLSKIEGIK